MVWPISAAEKDLPTWVPMPWNSGMVTNWMPMYGTGLVPCLLGSAALSDSSVTLANGAALMYASL
ncbi:hypothetical protein D3C81_2298380 [compost metagenome]